MALTQGDRNPGREQAGQGHGSGDRDAGVGIPDSTVENAEPGAGRIGGTRKGDDDVTPPAGPSEGRDSAPRGRGRDKESPWLGGG
jgi:hypothetical protein